MRSGYESASLFEDWRLLELRRVLLTRATRRNIPEDAILHSPAVKTSDLT
jgi:hypothetical protein